MIDFLSPANPPHARIVRLLATELMERDNAYLVDLQNPMDIDDSNAFEPDLACLRYRDDNYATERPIASDALFVIEVADTERKPRRKIARYLRAGTPQAWLVDISRRRVEIYTSPGSDPMIVEDPSAFLTFLDLRIDLRKLFG